MNAVKRFLELLDELDSVAETLAAFAAQSRKVQAAQVVARLQPDDQPVLVVPERVLPVVGQFFLQLPKELGEVLAQRFRRCTARRRFSASCRC